MGKHLTVYGGNTLRSGMRSYHSFDYYGEDSPQRQAQIAIEGKTKLLNPWVMIWESSPGAIVQPGKLEITLADPWDAIDTERMGVLWSAEEDANFPQLVAKRDVREGATVYVDVKSVPPNAERLQVWLTDDNGATVRYITNAKEAEEAEVSEANKVKRDLSDTLKDTAAGVSESTNNLKWSMLGLGVVVLAGAAVYFGMQK